MKEYRLFQSNIDNNRHYIVNSDIESLHCLPNQNLSFLINNQVNTFNLDIDEDAIVNIYVFLKGKRDFQSNINLIAPNATCNYYVVGVAGEEDTLESNILIDHLVHHTKSTLSTYAIGNQKAKITLNNNAHIKQGAYKSEAFQQAKGLSISLDSSIKAQPNLFIDEYDVSASHGVAMGSLNQDELFYLMSRGLSLNEAAKIVTMGFIEPFLKEIDNEEITERIRGEFLDIIKE